MIGWLSHRLELSRGGAAANVRPMEGLRGLAVFLVFLVHYVTLVTPWTTSSPALAALGRQVHAMGNVGVDLFFVLSGYLIYGALLSRPQPFTRFMARRVVRIYPAFLAVFALYLLLSWRFPAESKIPREWGSAAVYLLQNLLLLPGLLPIQPMITVAWSLSYEMFYYLAVPILVEGLALRKRHAQFRVSFFLALGVGLVVLFLVVGGPLRLVMFVAGILLFEAHEQSTLRPPSGRWGALALAVALVTATMAGGPMVMALKTVLLGTAFFCLCLAAFNPVVGWLGHAFCWTPLRWLGNMSYSYYLLHGLALKAAFMALGIVLPPGDAGAWMFWAALAPMFVLTLVPSLMLFLCIERPYSLARTLGEGPTIDIKQFAPNTRSDVNIEKGNL